MASKGWGLFPLSMTLCVGVALINEFAGVPMTILNVVGTGGVMFPYKQTGPNAPYLARYMPEKKYPAIPEGKH